LVRRISPEALKALFLEVLGSLPRLLEEEGYVLALWDKT
jgi:hypothetical protein